MTHTNFMPIGVYIPGDLPNDISPPVFDAPSGNDDDQVVDDPTASPVVIPPVIGKPNPTTHEVIFKSDPALRKGDLPRLLDSIDIQPGDHVIIQCEEEVDYLNYWEFMPRSHTHEFDLTIEGNGATLDRRERARGSTSIEAQGLIVANRCRRLIINDLKMLAPPFGSFSCIRGHNNHEFIQINDCYFDCQGNGIQGDFPVLEVFNSTFINGGAANPKGKDHCIYQNSSVPGSSIRVESTHLESVNGNVIRYGAQSGHFFKSNLIEGLGNTASCFSHFTGEGQHKFLELEMIQQAAPSHNKAMFTVYGGNGKYQGGGTFDFEKCTLTDESNTKSIDVFKNRQAGINGKPAVIWVDSGDNTYNGQSFAEAGILNG